MTERLSCNGCGAAVVLRGPGVAQTQAECVGCGYRLTPDYTDD